MKITANDLRKQLEQGEAIALIDVRTPVEHDEMHIAGSKLMPLDQLDVGLAITTISDAGQAVIICRSGKRAQAAYDKLAAAGCADIRVLDGGVLAWESAGHPLTRGEKKRLPLMRQTQIVIGLGCLIGSILALTVDVRFAFIPAFFGAGLTFAGTTGWCGLAIALSKMPWNKVECGCKKVTSCSIG